MPIYKESYFHHTPEPSERKEVIHKSPPVARAIGGLFSLTGDGFNDLVELRVDHLQL
jgi:hypothetical protein